MPDGQSGRESAVTVRCHRFSTTAVAAIINRHLPSDAGNTPGQRAIERSGTTAVGAISNRHLPSDAGNTPGQRAIERSGTTAVGAISNRPHLLRCRMALDKRRYNVPR